MPWWGSALIVYGVVTAGLLALGMVRYYSPYGDGDDERTGARMVLTCWAWPVWLAIWLWLVVGDLLETAGWKR